MGRYRCPIRGHVCSYLTSDIRVGCHEDSWPVKIGLSITDIVERVHRCPVDDDLNVQVRTGGPTGLSDLGNAIARADRLPLADKNFAAVGIEDHLAAVLIVWLPDLFHSTI